MKEKTFSSNENVGYILFSFCEISKYPLCIVHKVGKLPFFLTDNHMTSKPELDKIKARNLSSWVHKCKKLDNQIYGAMIEGKGGFFHKRNEEGDQVGPWTLLEGPKIYFRSS